MRQLAPQALAALGLERDAETAVELAGAVVRNDSAERDTEVISASGCVKDLELIREVAPSLNAAALRALLEWRFKPADVQGVKAPVRMNATVLFTLR